MDTSQTSQNEGQRRKKSVKSTGIVRKVDELGRIVLPIELRRTLDIAEREALEIYVDGTAIVLKKYRPCCIFCDSAKDIVVFRGKNICPKCLKEIKSV
ncbi:MAG: AbrB/MazE/SpoVT family DNA-binding domain-containing protein [Clostridia bacterium]|nr:AbrB/MazE/SpoVT family DNA-binding domain-containing protein [Oscillospiraceae bacterium]MBP3699908.1 AbrB/MazE/SpoVT family DNA-binding domain-containing protein [Oscillospiraceae bacterium]MBQ2806570.1 AbrB/MazE/SpoVT family DNA-binding domain-containing protein [Clostridia bacterium]